MTKDKDDIIHIDEIFDDWYDHLSGESRQCTKHINTLLQHQVVKSVHFDVEQQQLRINFTSGQSITIKNILKKEDVSVS